MKIAVVGTGYVGLVTGTCFAESGNDVTCIDIDETKVEQMKAGSIPIYEPGLELIFKRNIKDKRLTFTTSLKEGIEEANIIFLALPTPENEDGAADLSYVFGVADELGHLLTNYAVVVDKSTVPVGTALDVRKRIALNSSVEFDVVSNPEFLREGHAVEDFQKPDRVVIGSSSKKATRIMEDLYRPFVRQGHPVLIMDEFSAEMTKYTANAALALRISFMNEIANLCELVGANVDDIRLGVGLDKRIGDQFLYSGIGYGGSCFPKDVKALEHAAKEVGYDFKLIKSTSEVNKVQKHILAKKVSRYYKGNLKNKKFALWGLAFKPDTDDIREAPALEIIEDLTEAGAKVVAYDPEATNNVRKKCADNKNLTFAETRYDALDGADALLIATEWLEFRTADFDKIKALLKEAVIFDGRNLYDPKLLASNGFYYESIGRRKVDSKEKASVR